MLRENYTHAGMGDMRTESLLIRSDIRAGIFINGSLHDSGYLSVIVRDITSFLFFFSSRTGQPTTHPALPHSVGPCRGMNFREKQLLLPN
jgi:hypothetical protein